MRRLTAAERVLTCAFCGEAYPPGSPTHGVQVLTVHIKSCPKHPIRRIEEKLKVAEQVVSAAHDYLISSRPLGNGPSLRTRDELDRTLQEWVAYIKQEGD